MTMGKEKEQMEGEGVGNRKRDWGKYVEHKLVSLTRRTYDISSHSCGCWCNPTTVM